MAGGQAREQGGAKLFGQFSGVDQVADDPAVRSMLHAEDQGKGALQLRMLDAGGDQDRAVFSPAHAEAGGELGQKVGRQQNQRLLQQFLRIILFGRVALGRFFLAQEFFEQAGLDDVFQIMNLIRSAFEKGKNFCDGLGQMFGEGVEIHEQGQFFRLGRREGRGQADKGVLAALAVLVIAPAVKASRSQGRHQQSHGQGQKMRAPWRSMGKAGAAS